jgi:hypothetical protein
MAGHIFLLLKAQKKTAPSEELWQKCIFVEPGEFQLWP